LERESSRLLLEGGDAEKDLTLTPEERTIKILEIQELIAEDHQTLSCRGHLLFTLGNLHFAARNYEEAIAAYDEAVKIQPDYHQAWHNRGLALQNLERFSEAITSFDQAVKIKSDFHSAWNNRGAVLCDHLQRYEDAIASYNQAVKIQPELHEAWYNRGIALSKLGRFKKAITSLNKALKIKPDNHNAWLALTNAQYSLNLYHEAMASYDKFLELKPDYAEAWDTPPNDLDVLINDEEVSANYKKAMDTFRNNLNFFYKLKSLLSDVVGYENNNLVPSLLANLPTQYWQKRLAVECPEQSETNRESIILWLMGSDSTRFETLNPKELDLAKQAMEYRYRILLERYLGKGREQAYRNLIARLESLATLRNKIQNWVALSRDRQLTVVDVLQEVLQELLQSDSYIQQQYACIAALATDGRLHNALLFATVEEYCLRPVHNQPLLVYRFVNYLRRTQRVGLTQVPGIDSVRLVSEEILTDDRDNRVNLVDTQMIIEYQEAQEPEEEQLALRQTVKQEFENYLLDNLGPEAVQWLQLYLQGKSQDEIAKKLQKPIKEIYRLREKISYHAIRVFAMKNQPELVEIWLSISLEEHNLGLTQKQFDLLPEKLTAMQQQILELRKAGNAIDAIAQQLKLKTHEVMGEWTKIYLVAQTLRTGV